MQRELTLPPHPRSAGQARSFVRSILDETGHPEWEDSALLATSEVVTNAVLHAHTTINIAVTVHRDRLLVEVRDHNPSLPSQRHYDLEASTGRGLELVAALTTTYGVKTDGPDGKIVWFSLGTDRPVVRPPRNQDQAVPAAGAADDVQVVLAKMPPALWLAARQHHDALLRELALVRYTDSAVRQLVQADLARRLISDALDAVLDGLDPMPQAVDLVLRVPRLSGHAFAALQDTLDEAEALAAAELLLARAGLPEVVAVRDWACEQVIAQIADAPIAPWPGTAAERFVNDVRDDPAYQLGWDLDQVWQSERGAVAADQANRILAISPSLASALGWRADQIVGRRVVALIPARFREAHVAGFSRHLTTGETRVIGKDLTLPALCADGRELDCAVHIDMVTSPHGRTMYIAWITPPD